MSDRNRIKAPQRQAFYGDQPIRWFIGVVVEKGNDEPQLGRVKVRVQGVHGPDVSNEDLPYAQVMIPSTEPGTSGLGWNSALEPSATVFGMFLDGDQSQLPMVMGSLPVVHMPSATQIANGVAWSNDGSPGVGSPATVSSALSGPPDNFVVKPGLEYGGNVQYAWSYLKKNGLFTDNAIAALIGNFLKESGGTVNGKFDIRPDVKGDIGLKRATDVSIGIAQWYNGTARQRNLIKFAEDKGQNVFTLPIQLQWVEWEWKNVGEYNLNRLNNYKTIGPATVYVHHFYENPADTGARSAFPNETRGKKGIAKLGESERIGYAKNVHDLFTRSDGEPPAQNKTSGAS